VYSFVTGTRGVDGGHLRARNARCGRRRRRGQARQTTVGARQIQNP
jgi:hypothetical protein